MIPPQCGMLTIGALPITLPERITSMIFASVLNSLRKSGAGERRDRLVGRLRVRHAAEPVRAVAVDAAVAHVERRALDGGALTLRDRRWRRPSARRQAGADVRDRSVDLLFEITAPQTGMYGCVGLADSPSPWSMICRSSRGRQRLADRRSAPARPARRRRGPRGHDTGRTRTGRSRARRRLRADRRARSRRASSPRPSGPWSWTRRWRRSR